MKKQVVVVGLGRFGTSVARTLFEMGNDVLALDRDEKAIQNVLPHVTHAVQVDATDELALRELGIADFDIAVIGMGRETESSIMTTMLLKKLGIPNIIARATNDLHASILQRIGADRVVYPEHETGIRVARRLAQPSVVDYLEIANNCGISKLIPPEHFVGQTLADLDLGAKGKYGISVLAIKRGDDLIITPDRFDKVQPDDVLILAGTDEQLEKLRT